MRVCVCVCLCMCMCVCVCVCVYVCVCLCFMLFSLITSRVALTSKHFNLLRVFYIDLGGHTGGKTFFLPGFPTCITFMIVFVVLGTFTCRTSLFHLFLYYVVVLLVFLIFCFTMFVLLVHVIYYF